LAEFDDETHKKLQEALPRYASVLDPVDVLGDALADRIANACEIILQTNSANALVVILTPQVMTQIEKTAQMIGELGKKYQIPIFCSFIGGSLIAEGEKKLNELKIPSFRFPERAISTIASMWKWKAWQLEKSEIPQSGKAAHNFR
jgi:acyl-CoA synthetase (NDP forming)